MYSYGLQYSLNNLINMISMIFCSAMLGDVRRDSEVYIN